MAITASEARKNLFPLIEQVNNDRTPVEITSKRGGAVLIGFRSCFRLLQKNVIRPDHLVFAENRRTLDDAR